MCQNNMDEVQLNFHSDSIQKCLRKNSKRCNWLSANTQIEIVLEYFRNDTIDFWVRHKLVFF